MIMWLLSFTDVVYVSQWFAYAVIVPENFQSFYKCIKTYFKIKYKY